MCEHATMSRRCGRPHSYAQSFPGTPGHVRYVRAFIATVLDDFPGADDAVLLISELAANACAHSASGIPGGTFTVRADVCPGIYVRAEVEDQGSKWDGDIAAAESPHGLYLLRQLSADCGARRGAHGWAIWFTIAGPGPGCPGDAFAR